MASLSPSWISTDGFAIGKSRFNHLQTPFLGSALRRTCQVRVGFKDPLRRAPQPIRCEEGEEKKKKKKDEKPYIQVTYERPPYYSYMDSTSGQLEPALGARASIPEKEYWPEGTVGQVRAAKAPEPKGISEGSPSYGKNPGSRRKKYKTSASAAETSAASVEPSEPFEPEIVEEETMEDPRDISSEYVVYQTEPEQEEETGYELDKKIGRPHPFIDPKKKKPIEGILTSEELWWNWRKPEKEQWSRWQRRRPDTETVFLKAMAETGQVKLHGDHPTLTETSLYRARKHLYKEERLEAEQDRLDKVGPMAYYSEWVKVWKGDTSREAIQKHFEETGEDENTQLQEMLSYQTDREFRIMMGTDVRIRRDPLVMRMREELIKQIWGGDPVYPTINYIQDPNEVIDYRGPDFHEPTPNVLDFLKEHGKIISREELDKVLTKEKTEAVEMTDMDDAMARAVDIGETEDEEEDSEAEADGDEEEDEKVPRNWSVHKTTPKPKASKSKRKPKKEENMSLEEAIDDSENLTDFLMDFDEEQ